MGCVECKICHQNEEKNQFEYPQSTQQKEEEKININPEINNNIENKLNNTYSNINTNQAQNLHFHEEFEEKLKSIGKYISEEEFQKILLESEINFYQPNSPFPFINNNSFSHKMKPIEFEGGNIYEGEWNDNFVMDGHGKYFLIEEKVLAEGIWEKGELKKARIFYPNGEFYEGEMNNSCYNGKGKLINENKDIYEGEFLDGEKCGKGKINYFNGDIYEGNFLKNKFHGYGELTLENGLKYKGDFFSNFLEGKGILSFPPQETYEGDFEKNLFHGKGVYTYSNGDEYDGEFEFGIRKGKGIYKQKNGITFEGNWENNVPNGAGKIFFDDKVIKCNYHNGKIMDKPVDEDGLYYNNIDYNFYCEKMNLLGQSIPYLENSEENNEQYKAGTILSFLEDDE